MLLVLRLQTTPRLHTLVLHLYQVLPQNIPLHTCPLQAVVCQQAATRHQQALIRLATRRLLRTLQTGLIIEHRNIAHIDSFYSGNKLFSTRTCSCR